MNIDRAIRRQKKWLSIIERKIEKAKRKNDNRKLERMKTFLIKWIIEDMKDLGVILIPDNNEWKGVTTESKLKKIDISILYKYALQMIEEVENEVKRREKEEMNSGVEE